MNPAPVNAPQGATPAAGVQPGQSAAVVIANKVIVFGPNDGVFVYSGTPKLGNPPIFWAGSGPKDPYGNPLPSTAGVNGTGTFEATDGTNQTVLSASSLLNSGPLLRTVTLDQGQIIIGPSPAVIFANSATALTVGAVAPNPAACNWELPFLLPLAAVQPLTATTPETWHPMSPLAAGFSAGGTAPEFKLYPDATVGLRGAVNLTATEPAGTTFFTLPGAYAPTATMQFVTQASLSGNTLGQSTVQVLSTGAVRTGASGGSGGFVSMDGIRFPVD